MKEASGELNMTLITVIAVGAILIFIMNFAPKIFEKIENNWGTDTTSEDLLKKSNG